MFIYIYTYVYIYIYIYIYIYKYMYLGTSKNHRKPGSTGCRQDPGRTFKNKKMPGRMGSDRVTTQNLKILKIDPVRDLIYVRGKTNNLISMP
jgi:ribosomal protein L3